MNLNLKKKCFWLRLNKWLCGGGFLGILLKKIREVFNFFRLFILLMYWYKSFDCVNYIMLSFVEKFLFYNIKIYK